VFRGGVYCNDHMNHSKKLLVPHIVDTTASIAEF